MSRGVRHPTVIGPIDRTGVNEDYCKREVLRMHVKHDGKAVLWVKGDKCGVTRRSR